MLDGIMLVKEGVNNVYPNITDFCGALQNKVKDKSGFDIKFAQKSIYNTQSIKGDKYNRVPLKPLPAAGI